MKKSVIAMAVAGVISGGALAQSNVTIYGVMDTTWETYKVSDSVSEANNVKSHTRLATNSSYIGFKGAESLGDGLTAVFQFENGANSDSGGWGAARDTMVALAGGFGTVAAGNLSGPIKQIGAAVDFNPGAAGSGFSGSIFGEINGIKTGTDDRSRNAVAYISPTIGGLYGVLVYQNGTPASDASTVAKDSHAWTGGLVYANGPVFAAVGYLDAKEPNAVAANDRLKNYRLAAKYTLGTGTSISGLWDNQKYSIGSAETKRTAYMLGVNQNFGANNIWLQYAKAKDLKGDLLATKDTAADQITLGYSYSLSKRTMLHSFYTRVANGDGATYDFYNNPSKDGGIGAGGQGKVFGAGMRHSF